MTTCLDDKTKKLSSFLFLVILLLSACQKKENAVGADFVGQRSPFIVGFQDSTTIVAYTVLHDSIPTTKLSYYMLGNLNDPEIGTSKCNIYTQYALPYDQFDFGGTPKIDSIVLQLNYASGSSFYGNLSATQNILVYELAEDLSKSTDSLYFSNRTYNYANNLIGQYGGTFENVGDSITVQSGSIVTKVAPHIRIRLDQLSPVLKNRFTDGNANRVGYFKDNSTFQSAFKGLAIIASANPGMSNGCITYMNLRSSVSSLVIYYNDSLRSEFPIYKNSVHTNQFNHTFNPTVAIEPAFSTNHYNVNYLQPSTGLKTRITFPYLMDYVKGQKISVTGAELIYTVKSGTSTNTFTLPNTLRLLSSDSLGRNDFILDQFIAPSYYGGYLEGGTTYRFNVVRQLQYIFDQYVNNNRNLNYGLNLLVPGDNPITAQRVVLDTKRGAGKFKLNFTYTVIK